MSGIKNYNPNKPGVNNGRFMGLPFSLDESGCVMLPVPWDVTTSYGNGTATAPDNILEASYQLDLCDPCCSETWKKGIFMAGMNQEIVDKNVEWRKKAIKVIEAWESGIDVNQSQRWQEPLQLLNKASEWLNDKVYQLSRKYLDLNKKLLLIGGDHSTPYGYLRALTEWHSGFGLLQIDAHCDLRAAYEGFQYSHASIMYNQLTDFPQIKKLVQVGIRDYCPEEADRIKDSQGRIKTHFMSELHKGQFVGETWADQCKKILSDLPDRVYVSLDIDGLDQAFCPNTGTPVPDGLQYSQVVYLLEEIVRSGRTIIGADLCEVGGLPHEWDGNVGARIAYKMALLLLES